jgi:hypothetical protein
MSVKIDFDHQQTKELQEVSNRVTSTQISAKPVALLRFYQRLRQFVTGLCAHVSADEMLVVSQVLPKAALARFCQMPLDAQRHSLNVLYTLESANWTDPDLAAAALLHDVGKVASADAGLQFSPWLRGPLVILEALAPHLIQRMAADDPSRGWRYLLHVHQHHPAIGAAWAAEDNCSELTCWLIAHHQDELVAPPGNAREEMLVMLQWADHHN